MDETTARSQLLGRMPELHRMFRERVNELGVDGELVLEIDFLVIAIWMFGDRELVAYRLEMSKVDKVIIGEGEGDFRTADLYRAILATETDTWMECVESLVDHIPHLPDLELEIRCEHIMKLACVVLERLNVVRSLRVCVYDAFNPSLASTQTFIGVLDRLGPLDYLILEGITGRYVFWSNMLKSAFLKPPREHLLLAEARDSHLITSLTAMRRTKQRASSIWLKDCIIDDDLFALLLTMPILRFGFDHSCRIRGNFLTAGDALASNTGLEWLAVDCNEVCSAFTEALSNGIANNTTLKGLTIRSSAVEPFSTLCRAVARNGSIQEAWLPVSSPMDEACMYELAQQPRLRKLYLLVGSGSGIFSWPAMATFLRANRSLKLLKIKGLSEWSEASKDNLCIMGQSLADNTSLRILSLPIRNGYAELVSGLRSNTTLRSLRFDSSPCPDTPRCRALLEQAIERNYGLEYVAFDSGGSTSLVDTICNLNKAGRKYMLTDHTSRMKGVHVLSRVINNLDCLYYHLRENPSLCNLNEHPNATTMATSPDQSRKRRRCM